jgi:hypothetical protein
LVKSQFVAGAITARSRNPGAASIVEARRTEVCMSTLRGSMFRNPRRIRRRDHELRRVALA